MRRPRRVHHARLDLATAALLISAPCSYSLSWALSSHRKSRIISHKYGVFAMSPKSMPIFSGLKTQKLANFLEILWDDSDFRFVIGWSLAPAHSRC